MHSDSNLHRESCFLEINNLSSNSKVEGMIEMNQQANIISLVGFEHCSYIYK